MYSGLGTGVAASAFIKHEIDTTIVEIDPAVYEAATNYFGLVVPDPKKVVIDDARSWVMRKNRELKDSTAEAAQGELFDHVVHDCFSGGGVPGHMFTQRFWQDLAMIVKPDGVVAVVNHLQ